MEENKQLNMEFNLVKNVYWKVNLLKIERILKKKLFQNTKKLVKLNKNKLLIYI